LNTPRRSLIKSRYWVQLEYAEAFANQKQVLVQLEYAEGVR
jgi:hypothetical protein